MPPPRSFYSIHQYREMFAERKAGPFNSLGEYNEHKARLGTLYKNSGHATGRKLTTVIIWEALGAHSRGKCCIKREGPAGRGWALQWVVLIRSWSSAVWWWYNLSCACIVNEILKKG